MLTERTHGSASPRRVATLAILSALVGSMLVIAAAREAHAACNTAICVGGATACTISGTNTIDDDCTLNWSGKDVTLASGASLKTAADGQNFAIVTDDFDVSGTIQSRGAPLATPLTITTAGYLNVHSTGKIDVSRGGHATVDSTGAVQFDGTEFNADGGGSNADAGSITISSDGAVSTTGAIHATGSGGGFGGRIDIESTTSTLSIGAAVTANGASGTLFHHDGGTIIIASAGDMTIGANVTANGNGTTAWGGSIDLTSGGNVIASGKLHASGDSDGEGGGITVEAVDEAEFGDTVKVNGGAGGGTGGGITITAASVLVSSDWSANGGTDANGGAVAITAENGDVELQGTSYISAVSGNGGDGDTIEISATGNVTLNGELFASASGGGTGGDVTVSADGNVTVAADIVVDAAGTDSSGGTITITGGTNHTVTISQLLAARSTSSTGWFDGGIAVSACNVTVTNTGILRTRNTSVGSGTNVIDYQGTLTVAGSALADDPAAGSCASPLSGNVFACRCVDTTPADGTCDTPLACVSNATTTGATITPTALVCPVMMAACS